MTMNRADNDSSQNTEERVRILLLSPLPPPNGGIATWTTIVLKTLCKFDDLEVFHIDTAVRWRHLAETGLLLRMGGAPIKAIWNISYLGIGLCRRRPNVVHLCSRLGPQHLGISW